MSPIHHSTLQKPNHFLVLLTLWLVTFSSTSQVLIIAPILPRIGEELQIGEAIQGTLITSYGVMSGLFALLAGPISDRIGRRRILLLGAAWMAIALYLHGAANTYPTLLLVRAAAGGAGGVLAGAAVAYVGDFFPYNKRGWANGWIMSGFAAGQVLGIPIGAATAELWGFYAPFIGFAVCMTGAFALTWFFVPQPDVALTKHLSIASGLQKYSALLRQRATLTSAISSMLMFVGVALFISYFPTWLEAKFEVSGGAVAIVFMVGGIAAAIINPLAGKLSDRFGRKTMILWSCLSFAAVVVATPWVVVYFWLAHLVFFLTMATASMRISPFQSLLSALVPAEQRGSLLSLTSAFGQMGFALGGSAAGLLYSGLGFWACCLFGSASILLMALLVWAWLPEPSATTT